MHWTAHTHFLLSALLSNGFTAQAQQGGADADPYAPVYTNCPSNLRIRDPSDVCHVRSCLGRLS